MIPAKDLDTLNLGSPTPKSSRHTITDGPTLESLWPHSTLLRAISFVAWPSRRFLSSEMIIFRL